MASKSSVAAKLQAVGDEAFGFRVIEIKKSRKPSERRWRMKFVKNDAELVWVENADNNKAFAIAFRTLSDDDTGVAHIIEHSVLCGSKKFPVKEPFVELLKSSPGSYQNAYTRSDATVYPVASCNDRDLLNLAEVYLDAVFAPRSIRNAWAMPQERNIVFNEMKGAMSSPSSLAFHELSKMLFPSNAYGHNYGGDPAVIPTLTMKKYRAFYERFYHPSNALAFLYGKIDIAPMLKLVASYLRRYPRREIPAQIPLQPPVSAERVVEYPCDAVVDRTRICEGWVFGTWRDGEKETAMNVVRDILAGSNEAPLTKALLDAGVCENFSMACFDGHQNRIHATFTNVRDGKIDEARRIFRETLERQIKEGFDVKKISAALDKLEFWTREPRSLDPAGIRRLSPVVGSWLYGGYQRPVRPMRMVRGMVVGTLLLLVFYSLLDESQRYSRMLLLMGCAWTLVATLGLRLLLSLFQKVYVFFYSLYTEILYRVRV